MDIQTLMDGPPEQQAMLRGMAEKFRKAERIRAAVMTVALEDYDASARTTEDAADFCRATKRAEDGFRGALSDASKDLMLKLMGGEDLMEKLGDALAEHRIHGMTLDSEGNVCGMGEDGPTEIPEDIKDLVARIAKVPGMLPPPLTRVVEETFGSVENALFESIDPDTMPVGESTIDGIDLDLTIDEPVFHPDSIRDFDGGLGS